MSARRSILSVAILALLTGLLAPPLAGAADAPTSNGRYPVAPGIVREAYRAGSNDVQILRFDRNQANISLVPELAGSKVPAREGTHLTLRRLGDNALAAVNANFFFPTPGPYGEPEGLFIRDGVYVSEPVTKGHGWRGGFALFHDGTHQVGRPAYRGRLVQPDGLEVPVSAVNRHPARPRQGHPDETEVTILTPAFGRSTLTPSGTTELVIPELKVTPNLDTEVVVAGLSTRGDQPIPPGGAVIAASGQLGKRYAGLAPGTKLGLKLSMTDVSWDGARHAVAAGPVLVQDGKVTATSDWNLEGFGAKHNDNRHPRTIIGFRDGGETLLVTVDGRQSDSPGMTTTEAARLMVDLGVRDAVMLDGGGSTTMAVDGAIVNDPCCDSQGYRAVASQLVVWSRVATPNVSRIPGWDRYEIAANVARRGWGTGTDTVVLASGWTYADALAGGPFAADRGWPLLLTRPTEVPTATMTVLQELGVRRAILLGGEAAVGKPVVEALAKAGISVKRIGGADRTETAANVARYVGPSTRVFLASGSNFPDALSATVPAASVDAPLVTTYTDRLSDHVLTLLSEFGAEEVVVAGGPAAVSDKVTRAIESFGYRVTRVAGEDRYATSTALADWAVANGGLDTDEVAFATGTDYPDALVGGPWAAQAGVPLVLTHPLAVDRAAATRSWVAAQPLAKAHLVGGRANLATWVAYQLEQAITGGSDGAVALPSPPPLIPG